MGADEIWIGNLAYYNEGRLVGGWLELPCEPEKLGNFLRDHVKIDRSHEEYAIFDIDFDGPLGKVGYRCGDWTGPEEVNALSWILGSLSEDRLAAVGAYVRERGDRGDALEVANAGLQADEIVWSAWPDDGQGYSSDEERLAYWYVDEVCGGIMRLDEDTLKENFDLGSYGRQLASEDIDLGSEGGRDFWMWAYGDELCDDLFTPEEIHERAQDIAAFAEPWYESGDTEHAAEALREVGASMPDAGDAQSLLDAALLIEDLDERDRCALAFYSQRHMGALAGPIEYANLALQAAELPVHDLEDGHGSEEERLATEVVREYGVDKTDLANHFDYEGFGSELSEDGFSCHEGGVLEADASDIDLARYSAEEIRELAFGRESPLSSLEAECSLAAAMQGRIDAPAVERPR